MIEDAAEMLGQTYKGLPCGVLSHKYNEFYLTNRLQLAKEVCVWLMILS